MAIQTLYTQAFGIAVFAFQAPLLGPRAFGLVAIVMIFVSLFESLLVDTTTDVLISLLNIEEQHYATMNGITLIVAAVIGIALMICAGPLSSIFREPELQAIFRCMAILPLISAFGSAPTAATKRQMAFKPLAIRMISGVTCGGITGIVLTLLGAGAWALVWQAVVQRFISVAVLWKNSELPFRVGLSRRHWLDLAHFTKPLLLSRTMSWGASQLPRLILGLNLTVTELGLFSLASRLSDILVQLTLVPRYAVARVELRRHATDPMALNIAVDRTIGWMSALCFPLSFCGAALVPTLIHLWLNPKWFGAIVPAQALLLSACSWVSFYGGGAVFLAVNQPRREALMSTLQALTIFLVVLIFGAQGLIFVSVAMSIRSFLLIPLEAVLLRKYCHVLFGTFLRNQGFSLCAAIGSGVTIWLLRSWVEGRCGNAVTLVALGILGIFVYALLLGILAPQLLRQLLSRDLNDVESY